MSGPLDLAAYFERVEWLGPTAPGYPTLAGLTDAHIAHIPFENFDVLLGRGIRLDLAGLQRKLVVSRRGGYCFEHATLFAAVLEALGFHPVRHAARVLSDRPRQQAARTHMILSVTLAGSRYVVDPGFGRFASRLPLPLDGRRVPPGHPTHRIVHDADGWTLMVTHDGSEAPAWQSTLEEQYPIDFEVANHYTATHPNSRFRNAILATAVVPDGRVSIMNRSLTTVRHGETRKDRLADRAALRAVLREDFGFDLPEMERLPVPEIPEWR